MHKLTGHHRFLQEQDNALGDPTRNHYQVHTRGNLSNSADITAAVSGYKNEPFFNNNQPHTVEITYTPGVILPSARQILSDAVFSSQVIGAEFNCQGGWCTRTDGGRA